MCGPWAGSTNQSVCFITIRIRRGPTVAHGPEACVCVCVCLTAQLFSTSVPVVQPDKDDSSCSKERKAGGGGRGCIYSSGWNPRGLGVTTSPPQTLPKECQRILCVNRQPDVALVSPSHAYISFTGT